MTDSLYSERTGIQEPTLYLDRNGDLYQLLGTRAELIRHLHFQRRLVSHLVDVLVFVTRSREVSR